MTSYACLFEAKSIQEYILRSGRLRHIVGASELIDSLTGNLLDEALQALRLTDGVQVRFSRRAGGAIYLFTEDRTARDAFRDLWSLLVAQYAPNLDFILATGEGAGDYAAFKEAADHLTAARNRRPAALPAGSPVTRYARRTGLPAVQDNAELGPQDAATARFERPTFRQRGGLTQKFSEDVACDDWPRNLEYGTDEDGTAFPFWPDNRYLGLLHADGNGLGQLLIRLSAHAEAHPEVFVDLFSGFSRAVAEATQAAAKEATAAVLLPTRGDTADGPAEDGAHWPMPARPIVLGGDDLTILIRADLALPFTVVFLCAFERQTRLRLAGLRAQYPSISDLPEVLTAGAGIAFVRSNHPFYLAHDLAENLAKYAKDRAKHVAQGNERTPPTLAFHRVTNASHGDYADILRSELTYGTDANQVQTTLGVYGIDPQASTRIPALEDLQKLTRLLGSKTLARGPARQVLTLMGQDLDAAGRRYTRWREVMKDRYYNDYKAVEDGLQTLCGELADDLPVTASGQPRATPLGDVATLLAVSQGAPFAALANTEDTR